MNSKFPVAAKISEIDAALANNRAVVLTAPPGSGKTTCVPPALLNAPWLKDKKIVMLEPRRLAARNCAAYIAKQLGEPLGETVGYQVRLERKVSARTRLEIVTEGLLAQRLINDPELADTGLVIFDEFHERSLACDLAFALALDVRRALRPDLRLLVMSATLDAEAVSSHLQAVSGAVSVVRAEGRMYPVATKYLGEVSTVAAAGIALRETDGDVLCFLPGEGEIRRALAAFPPTPGVEALPLYGALAKEDQDRVFLPSPKRKVIFSTSIAETSVTLEGVTAVVDSGLMRVPRFSPGTGMTGLVTLPLTQDRAEQRCGRAGRVREGVCYRLWSEAANASRPAKAMPEILDADLASLVLACASWGALAIGDLPWMTPPPASAWQQAQQLLKLLGAFDVRGQLTEKGKVMARLSMHPRLANMCFGSGGSPEAALLAAIVEEGVKSRETDIRLVMDQIRETPNRPESHRILQLAKRFTDNRSFSILNSQFLILSEGHLLALAYPDRIAKNRGNGTFTMVSGRGAVLDREDALAKAPYLVCCELDDRTGDAKIFRACPIDEDEILAQFGDQIVETQICEWDRANERVKAVVRRQLGAMTIKEVRSKSEEGRSRGEEGRSDDGDAVVAAMLEGISLKGIANLPCWTKETLQLRARLAFVHKLDSSWAEPTDEAILAALPGFLSGMTKWRDLEKLDLGAVLDYLNVQPSSHDRRELDRLAPTRMEVPSGSHMLIHYEGDEPTCEVRLQECFGLMSTPKVGGGKVPVVMTLLSPAQRPCAVTKDLENFWREGYPLVRKDLRGRYPKHYWPEDPFTAVATRRVRPPR